MSIAFYLSNRLRQTNKFKNEMIGFILEENLINCIDLMDTDIESIVDSDELNISLLADYLIVLLKLTGLTYHQVIKNLINRIIEIFNTLESHPLFDSFPRNMIELKIDNLRNHG